MTGALTERSITIVAPIYAISIAVSSRNKITFVAGIVTALFAVAAYATQANQLDQHITLRGLGGVAGGIIVGMTAALAGERYNRHVGEGAPFFEFKFSKNGTAHHE